MNKIGQYKISVNLKKKFANNLTTFSQIYFIYLSVYEILFVHVYVIITSLIL